MAEYEKLTKSTVGKQVDAAEASAKSAASRVGEVKDRALGKWGELEEAFDKRLNSAISRLGVPSRNEVEALHSKVDTLTKQIEKLTGASVTPVSKTTAAKPAGQAALPSHWPRPLPNRRRKPPPSLRRSLQQKPRPNPQAKPVAKTAAAKPAAKAVAKPVAAKPAAKPAASQLPKQLPNQQRRRNRGGEEADLAAKPGGSGGEACYGTGIERQFGHRANAGGGCARGSSCIDAFDSILSRSPQKNARPVKVGRFAWRLAQP